MQQQNASTGHGKKAKTAASDDTLGTEEDSSNATRRADRLDEHPGLKAEGGGDISSDSKKDAVLSDEDSGGEEIQQSDDDSEDYTYTQRYDSDGDGVKVRI